MSGSVILFRFDEPAGVPPSDALGNLGDLGVESGITGATVVSAWTGGGRAFTQAGSSGYLAADLPAGNTLLVRDVTIQAIVALTLTGAAGPQTLIAGGSNDGTTSERYDYGLELEEQAGFAGFVEVRWFWQDSTATIKTQPAGVYKHPGDGAFFLLTATRRWESTGRVVVRYYVNDQLLGELVSADGDISGGTTGHTSIGARKAAGAWGRRLNGTIDELRVASIELSLEEIRETWRRLTDYQPGGVETFNALAPPGAPWNGDILQRDAKVVGQALGRAAAAAEKARALLLPDAATLDNIAQWEGIDGLSAKPRDSLDVRRARLVAYESRSNGFALPQIQEALSGPLALAPADVQIIEFTNTVTDDFAATIAPERWITGSDGVVWSIVAGELQAFAVAGGDLRWDVARAQCYVRTPIEPGRLYVSGKLSSYTLPLSAWVGMLVQDRVANSMVWFGVRNNAGVLELGYYLSTAGAFGAWNLIASGVTAPIWLRMYNGQGSSISPIGSYQLAYSVTSATTGFSATTVVTGVNHTYLWAGFGVLSTIAATASNLTAKFDDYLSHMEDSLRPFEWYAYRDPALLGTPDMAGAQGLVQKIKPTHTYAAAIGSKSVLCDDPVNGLCDRGPMGAL